MHKLCKCIICEEHKEGTEEHVIPKSLGNETLKMYNVCKECNSGLGIYVDNYFVNHRLIQIIRQNLKLKGQSGQVPNPFYEAKDKDGIIIRVDDKFTPSTVPALKQMDNKIIITAPTKEEAIRMAEKRLKRMGFSGQDINERIQTSKKTELTNNFPEVTYEANIDLDKFYLFAIKIAYEYGCSKLGEDFLIDKTAIRIREILYQAINGNFDEKYEKVMLLPDFFGKNLKHVEHINCHMIMLNEDNENQLIVNIILFMSAAFSFSVCISENASDYHIKNYNDIIEIKTG